MGKIDNKVSTFAFYLETINLDFLKFIAKWTGNVEFYFAFTVRSLGAMLSIGNTGVYFPFVVHDW